MATSLYRREKRKQDRLKAKIEKQFMESIKGKNTEEVAAILERIRIKYNLDQFNTVEEQ